MINNELIADGYGDNIVVTTDEQPDITSVKITYKGQVRRKRFKGETSHHDAQRWVDDNTIPIIHAGRKTLL